MAGNSVANAIVTVVPKLDSGGKKSLEKEMGKTGTSSGDKFGEKFGGSLKKLAGSAVVVGAAKLAGEVFAQAFNNAAEYEQLSGGVEKIFDTMDTSRIFSDARGAYKDLNMSANDYLEIINDVGASFSSTMGDEKGYDVARTGLKAIADYSSGTGKSMDVLKEKFGMITRSTSSYQSIADQFSGILPATSSGFLEAAQSAGILSENYTSLTQVPIDEYQEAVSKMLEQGVKDLGLYGNTAKETEGTVSGSLAGLKASWDNLLTAMGTGENVEESAQQIVDSFITALENIIPLAGQVMLGMGQALVTALGQLLADGVIAIASKTYEFASGFGDLITSGIDRIKSFTSDLMSAGGNIVQGIIDGILSAPSSMADALIQLANDAKDKFLSFWGIASPSKLMREYGGYIGSGLSLGIEDSSNGVERAMNSLMGDAFGIADEHSANIGVNGGFGYGGNVYHVYVNGAVVNSDSAIQDSMYSFLTNLQRRAAM